MDLHPLGSVFIHDNGALAVNCKACKGYGDFVETYSLSPADETPYERLIPCEACDGQGWVEIDLHEIEDDRCEEEQEYVPLAQLLRQQTA